MCSAQMFLPLQQILQRDGYKVEIIQFTNQRTIADMVRLCQEKITTSGTVLGFSMGGIVALELIKQSPELVENLILLSANSHADRVGKGAVRKQHIALAKSLSLEQAINRYYLPHYFHAANETNHKLVIDMANELGVIGFERQLTALSTRNDNLEVIRNYTGKVLILAGQNDQLCPINEQQKMLQVAKQATLKLISDCGHFPLQEQQLQSIQTITSWLASINLSQQSTEFTSCH